MIEAYYTFNDPEKPGMIEGENNAASYRDIVEIINDYPWEQEMRLSEERGGGGGFYFGRKGENGEAVNVQFVPFGVREGLLLVDVTLKPGFLGFFGRKATSVDFDVVKTDKALHVLKQLCEYPIAKFYDTYKNK